MPKTIAIQYGIMNGPYRGKKLRRALTSAGYKITPPSSDADVLIGHSAGCFWLPPPNKKQLVILVDPPYWPGKSVPERARQRSRSNWQFSKYGYPLHYFLQRSAWSFYYALVEAKRTIKIVNFAPKYDLAATLKNRRVLLVRNEADDWLTSNLDTLLTKHDNVIVKYLPGDHDDIWYNPQPYVELIKYS